jgi:hypothetical protein
MNNPAMSIATSALVGTNQQLKYPSTRAPKSSFLLTIYSRTEMVGITHQIAFKLTAWLEKERSIMLGRIFI